MGITNELRLVRREMLQQQRRQVTIFTEVQQVLHVQCVDAVLRVVLDDLVADEQRLVRVRGTKTVERETTGQTGDGTEETFERFGHVVGNEVLIDLHHRDDGLLRVRKLCFTTDTKQLLVVNHSKTTISIDESNTIIAHLRGDQPVQGERRDSGIGIHHEHILVEGRVDTDDVLDLVVHLELKRVHRRIEVDLKTILSSLGSDKQPPGHTLFKKCITTIWESRFPRLPGRDLSFGLPTLTTTR